MEGFNLHNFNRGFINLLFLNIHPNPRHRLSLKETANRFKKLLLQLTPSHIYLISSQMHKHKGKIIKTMQDIQRKTTKRGNILRLR